MGECQGEYMAPSRMLAFLADMEEKKLFHSEELFVPGLKSVPVTVDALNAEVRRMMDFIGMKGYEPKCEIADLSGKHAGFVDLSDSAGQNLCIKVSRDKVRDIAAVEAILAHELCHKYLDLHELQKKRPEELYRNLDEYFADLCTIYVGFGDIVLRGYNGGSYKMGYLTPDVYRNANAILSELFCRRSEFVPDNIADDPMIDPMVEDCLGVWRSYPEKSKLPKGEFIKAVSRYASLSRNVEILKNILDVVEPKIKAEHCAESERCYTRIREKFGDPGHVVRSFGKFYSVLCGNVGMRDFGELSLALDGAILALTDFDMATGGDGNGVYKSGLGCPQCGARYSGDGFVGELRALKCPKCGGRFVNDGRAWIAGAVRNVHKEMRCKEYKAGQEAGYKTGYEAGYEAVYVSRYNEGYNAGMQRGRRDAEAEISRLPVWLAWLVRKFRR